jgi:hypothetical protein
MSSPDPIPADDLTWLRARVGATPDDDELAGVYAQFAAVDDPKTETARWVLSKRLADFVASPAQMAVSGEVSRNAAANITALQGQLADLGGVPGVDGDSPELQIADLAVARFARPVSGRHRRWY